MGDRLNDTKAVIAMVPCETQSEHYSRNVRKIDNGYITSSHGYNPNDPEGPTHKEVFTRDHPDHSNAMMSVNGSAMKKAVEFMNRK